MSDLIDRQKAINKILGQPPEPHYPSWYAEQIKELPSAEPEPKRGKWVLVCDNNGMHFICNKCGAWRYHQKQKFCGECGAKMEVTT